MRVHIFIVENWINCGCFSNDLLIEELLRPGKAVVPGVAQINGTVAGSMSSGTILLNQIEDMSLKMQLSISDAVSL